MGRVCGLTIMLLALFMKNKVWSNTEFCQIAALCAVVAIMNGIYNISLRIESGYMIYFILAIPWCISGYKWRNKNENQGYYKKNCL